MTTTFLKELGMGLSRHRGKYKGIHPTRVGQ